MKKRHHYFVSYITSNGNISSMTTQSKKKLKNYDDIETLKKWVKENRGFNSIVVLSINYLGKFKIKE